MEDSSSCHEPCPGLLWVGDRPLGTEVPARKQYHGHPLYKPLSTWRVWGVFCVFVFLTSLLEYNCFTMVC